MADNQPQNGSEASNIDTATEPGDPSKTVEPELSNTPSQAEGDRVTILDDLREKEERGEI
ncbi:MAG TPA: hypothetical protein VGE45_17550 [Chloroflexia bacterium]|jgi:hypothetical protein